MQIVFGAPDAFAQTNPERITFSARDSLVISGTSANRAGLLFGGAIVNSGDVKLGAYHIEIAFASSELSATGLVTDTGTVERPTFEKADERFLGRSLRYNLKSRKGRVIGASSIVDDGYIYGATAKQASDSVLYVKDAMYTTCDREENPHYHIRAGRMKIVNGEWIYSGPMHLRILNIPFPIWLPFGFLPTKEGRRSGPLPPSYGEDDRGFFLRDFGWYFALNDYMDFQTRFGVWTNGSFEFAPTFRYAKRYGYRGRVAVDWVRNQRGLKDDPDFLRVDTWSLRANHDQTIGNSASITSKIDFTTSDYLRTASRDYLDKVRQTIGSDFQFNKRWKGRTFTVYMNQRQILTTDEVRMTLPRLSFVQQTARPFATGRSTGKRGLLETISVGYRGSLSNTYTFVRDTSLAGADQISWWDALWNSNKYTSATGVEDRFQFQVTHRVPISANFRFRGIPGVSRSMRLNVAPSFDYNEDWYVRTELRTVNDSTGAVSVSSHDGFVAIRQFSTSINANTELFGTFNSGLGPFRSFRHIMRPSVTMTFRPDFSSATWGYYRSYTDTSGTEVRYPIASGIGRGQQSTLSMRLGNVLQGKRVASDSSRSARTSVSQLLTLDAGMAHNFAADSLNWSPLNITARTRVLNKFDFNLNAAFSPYRTDSLGRTIHSYNSGLLRMTNAGFTVRGTFSGGRGAGAARPYSGIGGKFGDANRAYNDPGDSYGSNQNPFTSDSRNTPTGYADFSIPWSVAADFTYNVTKTGASDITRAIMNAGLDVNITPKWKVHGRSGYDFANGQFATTNISILRDFHDWEMGFNWTPFGQFASYQFDLHLKTGPLREMLRLRVPQSDIPDRFGQLTQ